MASDEKWYFSKEQLENSPSRAYNIDIFKEYCYRQQAANFIGDMGRKLKVSQLCINTATVYMHRFYVFHSFTHFPWHTMAAAALFLSAKVEEQPRKLEHVIRVHNMCQNPSDCSFDVNSDKYKQQSQDLVFNENVLLQTLGFDVAIDHPHAHVVRCCHLVRATKDLAQTSYYMASISLHLTTMCLQYKPTVVACFCIHLACKWSNWEIPLSNEKKEWFVYVDPTVTAELLQQLTEEFLIIFERCPPRLKEKIMAIGEGGSMSRSSNHSAGPFDSEPRRVLPPTDSRDAHHRLHHHDKNHVDPSKHRSRAPHPDAAASSSQQRERERKDHQRSLSQPSKMPPPMGAKPLPPGHGHHRSQSSSASAHKPPHLSSSSSSSSRPPVPPAHPSAHHGPPRDSKQDVFRDNNLVRALKESGSASNFGRMSDPSGAVQKNVYDKHRPPHPQGWHPQQSGSSSQPKPIAKPQHPPQSLSSQHPQQSSVPLKVSRTETTSNGAYTLPVSTTAKQDVNDQMGLMSKKPSMFSPEQTSQPTVYAPAKDETTKKPSLFSPSPERQPNVHVKNAVEGFEHVMRETTAKQNQNGNDLAMTKVESVAQAPPPPATSTYSMIPPRDANNPVPSTIGNGGIETNPTLISNLLKDVPTAAQLNISSVSNTTINTTTDNDTTDSSATQQNNDHDKEHHHKERKKKNKEKHKHKDKDKDKEKKKKHKDKDRHKSKNKDKEETTPIKLTIPKDKIVPEAAQVDLKIKIPKERLSDVLGQQQSTQQQQQPPAAPIDNSRGSIKIKIPKTVINMNNSYNSGGSAGGNSDMTANSSTMTSSSRKRSYDNVETPPSKYSKTSTTYKQNGRSSYSKVVQMGEGDASMH